MKRVFVSQNVAEVGLLQSMLETEGINCLVKNMHLNMIARFDDQPELWVSDDDAGRAEQLIARWNEQPEDELADWTCSNCGEEIEGQFGACWRCGEPPG